METRQSVAYTFKVMEIDDVFQSIGSSITKTKGLSKGLIQNLNDVLIAQTSQAKRQGMMEWIPDTDHVIVQKFSE